MCVEVCGNVQRCTQKYGSAEVRRCGDAEMRRRGDAETRRRGGAEIRQLFWLVMLDDDIIVLISHLIQTPLQIFFQACPASFSSPPPPHHHHCTACSAHCLHYVLLLL